MEDTGQKLLRFIKQSEIVELNSMLKNLSKAEIEHLFNRSPKKKIRMRFHYRHSKLALKEAIPLVFEAIIRGQLHVAKLLHEHGAKFYVTDANGWNIIHYLIVLSHLHNNYENVAVRLYKKLQEMIERQEFFKMLKQEDLEGLRPLEMALHYGCLQMFDVIVNTPEIYLMKVEEEGQIQCLWYDITDYEHFCCSSNRRSKNLVTILSNIDENVLKSSENLQVLRNGMLEKWTYCKTICNAPFIFIWFIFRFCAFLGFYMMFGSNFAVLLHINIANLVFYLEEILGFNIHSERDVEVAYWTINYSSNFTNDTRNEANRLYELAWKHLDTVTCYKADWFGMTYESGVMTASLLAILSVFSMGFDILEMIVHFFQDHYKWRSCFKESKKTVVSTIYYRCCHFMFSCLGLLWCWIYIEDPLNKYIKYGIIPTCYFSVWTILYFIQMLPAVGHFVNTIQRMLGYMLQFIVIYAFILIPYPFGFYILLRSTYGCTGPGFENPLEAFYTIFKIMLNMEDFSSYEELTDLQPTYLLHVLYVFTVAILLVNFLIALLSSSVGDVVQAGDVIMMLQRLSVVTVIEKRMLWIFPCFYKFMQHCLYTCENGRIYLVCSRYVNYEEYDTKIL